MANSCKNRFFLVLFGIFLSVFNGCSEEENINEIPVVAVNIVLNPNSTEYSELNTAGGWVYLTGGYRGIFVYRISTDEFTAFERACPHDWDTSSTRIIMDNSLSYLRCPSCNSTFNYLDGAVLQGPSRYPLRPYQTDYNGTILRIYN